MERGRTKEGEVKKELEADSGTQRLALPLPEVCSKNVFVCQRCLTIITDVKRVET